MDKNMLIGGILLIALIGVLMFTLFSAETPSEPIVGNDRDEHGCIPSAGYTWCEEKQKCVRLWEEGCLKENIVKVPCMTKEDVASETEKCLIIYEYNVYDFTNAPDWDMMGHVGKHFCGEDLTGIVPPHPTSYAEPFLYLPLC